MTATIDVEVSRQHVWDVLADGWMYSSWVVGASRIRSVDADWPAPGSRIKHSVGAWPVLINDETVVQRCVPLQELGLLASIWPIGKAPVGIVLADIPGGCRIKMSEKIVRGPLARVPEGLQMAAFGPRNRECLRRLALIAQHRQPSEIG